jgi:hypothetical protein
MRSLYSLFANFRIYSVIRDFLSTRIITVVSKTTTWGFYFLATHQDLQEKLYKEIKDVLGKDDVDHTNINDLV